MSETQMELMEQRQATGNPLVDYLGSMPRNTWPHDTPVRWANSDAILSYHPEWTSRDLREWAEESEGAIISSNYGYCLLEVATAEEINHFCSRMLSQGKKMVKRAIRTKRRAHEKLNRRL